MKKYVVAAALLVLVACSEKDETNTLQKMPVDLVAGKALAAENCKMCHGMDGRGVDEDTPNLAAQRDGYLVKTLQGYKHGDRLGNAGFIMDVAEVLSPAEMRHVAGYYASLPALNNPESEPLADYSYYKQGEALSEICITCHGSDGNPLTAGIPRLAGQHPEYLLKAIKAYQDGFRHMLTMHAELQGLSQADLENIVLYMALQQPKAAPNHQQARHLVAKNVTAACGKCHGVTGHSDDPLIPSLAGQDGRYLKKVMGDFQTEQRKHDQMQTLFAQLTESDMDKIALFYAGQNPLAVHFSQPQPIRSLVKQCAGCHSVVNSNPDRVAPKLEGQKLRYLINALEDYRQGERDNDSMHRQSISYSDATIEGIASYYSAQTTK